MINYEELIQRAANYMSMYSGEKFQCMKTPDPKDPRLGDIFTVTKIEPGQDGQLYVFLNDRSRMNSEKFNNCFSMLTESTPALPKEAVRRSQLSSVPKVTEFVTGGGMATLDQTQMQRIQQTAVNATEPPVQAIPEQAAQTPWFLEGIAPAADQAPVAALPQPVAASTPVPEDLAKSLFGMFALQPTKVEFEAAVDLPDLNLIQMMYSQSVNKEEFLTKFATYVTNSLTLDVVKKALSALLEPKAKKIRVPKA